MDPDPTPDPTPFFIDFKDPHQVLDPDPHHWQTVSSNIYISNNSSKIYKGTNKAVKDV
jgi:hypothetical protein